MLRRRRHGFSLVELMVALATLGLVATLALRTFTNQHRTYVVIDDVSEVQQSARAISSLLERDIRNAGYMVPSSAAACGVDRVDGPDTIFLSDSDAILPCCSPPEPVGQALDRSRSALRMAAETFTSPNIGVTTLAVNETVVDGNATYDTDGDGANDSDFQVGGGAILVDLANPGRGVACGFVTAVPSTVSITIDFVAALDNGSGSSAAAELRLVPAHGYRIVELGGVSRLERDGILLSRGVEDLQFAWYYDDDRDGQVDDPGETRGVPGTAYQSQAVDGSDLREIRFNVVSRTAGVDPTNPLAAGTGQRTENRDTAVSSPDGFRRRIQTATVRLRNVSS